MGVHRQHRRLDPDDRRHRAGHRLPAGGDPHERLLRRAPAGRQPVRGEPGRGRRRDRRADLALPVRPPPRLGLRRAVRPDPGRHHRRRTRDQGDRATDQAGLGLRLRPRHRRAGLAHRGAPRAGQRRSRRDPLAHPAVPHQAAAVRAAGVRAGRDHRSDPGARGRGPAHRPAVPLRPRLHAAHHARVRRQAGDAVRPQRRQLARRLLRSGDRHPLRLLPHPEPHPLHAEQSPAVRHGLPQPPGRRSRHDGPGPAADAAAVGTDPPPST